MDVACQTHWVVPFLDDVAVFLSENGMPESAGIIAEAAARVHLCSQKEAGLLASGSDLVAMAGSGRVLPFIPRSGQRR